MDTMWIIAIVVVAVGGIAGAEGALPQSPALLPMASRDGVIASCSFVKAIYPYGLILGFLIYVHGFSLSI